MSSIDLEAWLEERRGVGAGRVCPTSLKPGLAVLIEQSPDQIRQELVVLPGAALPALRRVTARYALWSGQEAALCVMVWLGGRVMRYEGSPGGARRPNRYIHGYPWIRKPLISMDIHGYANP